MPLQIMPHKINRELGKVCQALAGSHVIESSVVVQQKNNEENEKQVCVAQPRKIAAQSWIGRKMSFPFPC